MLTQIQERLPNKEIFANETILAIGFYWNLIRQAQLLGCDVVLYFFCLPTAEMAKERVKLSVSKGGHHIPPDVIERIGSRLQNFFPHNAIVDHLFLYKDVDLPPEPAAEGELEGKLLVYNLELWEQLKKIYSFCYSIEN
jgi:predicted ABC-type ATPase